MCRSRRELSNAYLLAKFGFDTAENEPFQVCPLSAYRSPRSQLERVRVKALSDGAEGWVSIKGNQGSVYLEPVEA